MLSLDQVTSLFCLAVAFGVCRTLPAMVKFYAWFKDCGLDLANHRGYGQSACKAYGLFGAPKLSVGATALSGGLFAACLVAVAVLPLSNTACVGLLCASLVFYHLYFSQLYCEAHVGAHVTVMVPPAIIMLALSAGRVDASGEAGVDDAEAALRAQAAAFTAWMCKIVLTASYCSAGISKVYTTLTSRSWIDGNTLQAFIFEASLLTDESTHSSFGVPTPFSASLQRLFMSFPRLLLMPMSIGAVAFETLAPLVLLAPPNAIGLPFAIFGVKFHYGICLLQNIDFVSWWGPMYAFFLLDTPMAALADGSAAAAAAAAAPGVLGSLPAAAAASFELAPLRTALAAAYVLLHLGACVVLRFMPQAEVLPLSCFPMFKNALDLFDPRCRKWHWLTEKPHATGTLKNYCCGPLARPQVVRADEIGKLPFKYALIGHGGAAGAEEKLYTNAELTPELSASLEALKAASRAGRGKGATDAAALPALLDALTQAKAAFAAAPRAEAEAAKPTDAATDGVTDDTSSETDETASNESGTEPSSAPPPSAMMAGVPSVEATPTSAEMLQAKPLRHRAVPSRARA